MGLDQEMLRDLPGGQNPPYGLFYAQRSGRCVEGVSAADDYSSSSSSSCNSPAFFAAFLAASTFAFSARYAVSPSSIKFSGLIAKVKTGHAAAAAFNLRPELFVMRRCFAVGGALSDALENRLQFPCARNDNSDWIARKSKSRRKLFRSRSKNGSLLFHSISTATPPLKQSTA